MTSSPDSKTRAPALDDLPPGLSSMWRLFRLGYRHEPGLLLAAFLLALLAALPDALLAFWFKLLGEGVLRNDRGLVRIAAVALGVSATATWFLRTVSTRVQRRFRDKVTIALEARDDRDAGQRSPRDRYRQAPGHRAARSVGTLVRPCVGGPLGLGGVAHSGVGGLRGSLRRRGRVRLILAPVDGRRRAARAGRRVAPVRLHRRDRRRDWLSARLLDGRLEAPRLARRLCP